MSVPVMSWDRFPNPLLYRSEKRTRRIRERKDGEAKLEKVPKLRSYHDRNVNEIYRIWDEKRGS